MLLDKTVKRSISQSAFPDGHVGHVIHVQAGSNFVVEGIYGTPGEAIPLTVRIPDSLSSSYLVLSFRGLPSGFTFSSGFGTADAWFVSIRQIDNLKLIPPVDFIGSFTIDVHLIRGQSVEPLIQSVAVVIEPSLSASQEVAARNEKESQMAVAAISTVAPGETVKPRSQISTQKSNIQLPKVLQIDPAKEKRLLTLARSMLNQNDIAAARLVYARLARQGSVTAALTLAQTFDPAYLGQYKVNGLTPNPKKAKHWYGVAARLGSADASGRLLALESGSK